ncbi:MAG: RDD family protein [candidate division Zixibacteria bacterium]|nr:RDD family protein [candidate division Zixibacteria bacterium]
MKSEPENQTFRYAGLWRRFLSLFVDFVFLSLFFFPITKAIKGTWMMGVSDHRWSSGIFITDPLCIAFTIIIVFYFILLEGLIGVTLGKRVVGIRVISLDGSKPGLAKSIIRNVLRIVDSLPVLNIAGIILILRSGECARFGDRIAGTRVIVERRDS